MLRLIAALAGQLLKIFVICRETIDKYEVIARFIGTLYACVKLLNSLRVDRIIQWLCKNKIVRSWNQLPTYTDKGIATFRVMYLVSK